MLADKIFTVMENTGGNLEKFKMIFDPAPVIIKGNIPTRLSRQEKNTIS